MITERNKIQEFYQALLERNSHYIGAFYVGVRTTNVFCISTCRARKPKLENVEFYTTAKEALQCGFRPCKICKPTENVDEPPTDIKHLINLVSRDPYRKLKDQDLRRLGYSPEKIRRWFKSHHGLTFQAYHRMIRMNCAYEDLKKGNNVTNSAFKSGYGSLSGFSYTFKNLFDQAPKNVGQVNVINVHRLTTPLGPMYVCATSKGICLLEFTDRRMLETEFRDLMKRLKARIITGKNEHIEALEKQIREYFDGERFHFEVPLDTPGTAFQKSVWKKLLEIPFGETRSYKQQAMALGKPNAVRAVASANGQNRVSIVIPCHRVIGSDGQLTGYGGGLPRKKWLLEHERKHLDEN